jgi:AraC family transcriptional activator of pobA
VDQHPHTEKALYHFSFLRDIKVYGIYNDSITNYFIQSPFIRKQHSHDFYTIMLVTKGEGEISINHNRYSVKANSVCLIASGQTHEFINTENIEGRILHFCQDFYVEEFSFLRLLNIFAFTSQTENQLNSPYLELSGDDFKSITEIIEPIIKEYTNYKPENNSVIIMRSFLNILLLKLSELFEKKSGRTFNDETIIVHKLTHLVDKYFIKEHNVAFYAAAFNISERQLNTICKNHFNSGLKIILTDRLMQEARKLILFSELSVAEISYKLNFEDNSYFNKVFRNKTGITPKKFRDLHKRLVP